MSDPFSLLPLALAGHAGRIDDYECQQLIAAGLTLLQRSAPLVRALSGKRAAIFMETSPQFFVALAACEGRGAVLINPLASRHEIQHQLRDANVGAVFSSATLERKLPDDMPRVLLDDAPRTAAVATPDGVREIDLGSHHGLSLEGDFDAAGSNDEAVIVYTSAMAGTPLGAILSHRNLLANARSTVAATGNTSDDTVLALLPFSHLFGLAVSACAPLLAGARVVTMPRFVPSHAASLLAEGKITELVGVPAVFRALLTGIPRRLDDTLRLCICGGAPLDRELQDRWFDATRVELRQGYGLTEAGPVCLFNRPDRPNVRGTLGTPYPGVNVKLGDDDEILVRGDNVFRGYVSGGDQGLQVQGGWLHTGDRGARSDDGSIAFAGVIKPMFTRNGFNIYPREIEQALCELPGVESAAVSASPESGPEASIVARIRGSVDEAQVRAWCSERLAAYKRPSIVRIFS